VAEDAKLGKILVDGKGMTLYMFTKDEADKSNCNAACLANWPALLTSGSPVAGAGVDASKLGSTATTDGRKIVTYNHFPLYYWVKDSKAGDTTGQNVGKVWFVVAPDGSPNKGAGLASPQSNEFTIHVAEDARLGKILVDSKGMTLYMFTKDEADKSNCNAACLANWPPLLAADNIKVGEGVDASKLGTTATTDGRKMVTYNHFPLYYWVKDTKAGDTTGQNVGKVWFVLSPDGSPNKTVVEAPKMADFTINVVEDAKLGKILVDSKGMTLYMFTKDEADKSNCNAACLANWPPLLAVDNIKVGAGVDASKLGTTTTSDGR
jgi:predicted lipoprotein with Yx(FWY)xxD motif